MDELQADREVVMAAMRQDGDGLRYALSSFGGGMELVLAAA